MATAFLAACAYGQGHDALRLARRLELAGVEGRIDHFSVDVKGNRLFVSALGNHTMEVLDIVSGKRLHTIRDLAEPQGVYYDPAANRIFVACAKDGSTKIFDGATYAPIHTVGFAEDADNIRYDARGRQIVVGYGSGALGFLDMDGKKMAEIALDGHPESFQLQKTGTRVFVNVPDSKEIEIADVSTKKLVGKWPITSALRNFPMALDEAHHRLLIGCRAPAQLLALDTESGAIKASVAIVGDTDDLFYDAENRRVYVIGGEGFVDVFDQNDANHYTRLARYPTAPGARTGLFVPALKELFVAVPHRGAELASILVYEVH
jgi:DNA-binding beta-propeller fold protein YncE